MRCWGWLVAVGCNLAGNILAAFDKDQSGTFNEGDLALDVQDNISSVSYSASNDVFTFIV